MTSPADELRAAAEALRALAAAASPGRWEQTGIGDIGWYVSGPCIETEDSEQGRADADYIAAMGPNVGTLLADWLAKVADFCDGVERTHGKQPAADNLSIVDALAVARALTGGQL